MESCNCEIEYTIRTMIKTSEIVGDIEIPHDVIIPEYLQVLFCTKCFNICQAQHMKEMAAEDVRKKFIKDNKK